jgi:uncharacterized membrane protein YbhN (UPF0104 family)
VGVVVAAVVIAVLRRHELATAGHLISQVQGARLLPAAAFEAASLVCFAAAQRWLLRVGGLRLPLRGVTALVLGANAVAGALPGGAAFSAAWLFQQFRRRGAAQVLAGAVLVVAGALSLLSLSLLILAGAVASGLGGAGAVADPVLSAGAVLAGLLLVAAVLGRIPGFRARLRRAWLSLRRRHRRLEEFESGLAHLISQSRREQPELLPWLIPLGLALLNWSFDAACLATCLWALGIGIPWKGLLLAYGLTQVPSSLRLTPGSIGIVETSLAGLLVVTGLNGGQAIAATLLYRIFSYWALQPIGWATWLTLTLRSRQEEAARDRRPADERRL